jgi:hypothetical protein
MVYATPDDVRVYCKKLTHANLSDEAIERFVQVVTDRDINPLLKNMYDLDSDEVKESGTVKQVAAMGAALDAMKNEYGSSKRSELKSDIEKTQEDYDMIIIHLRNGLQKV